jgi:cytochrome c oxidase subunit 2
MKAPPQKEIMPRNSVIAVLSLLFVGSHGLTSKAAGDAAPHRIEVSAKRFGFEPAELTLKKDEPVDLVLKSNDVPHGLRFKELNVDIRVSKGGTTDVHFTPNKAGTFVGHCSVFCGTGHGSMTLKLHVVE